ncbi:peptidylprolyl isomerase [Neoroseomonas oryzicola]|uniref:Parvulin-like PPIase n=1 Tax=Neoroseomonas oryzicola TaxID=535904 RepID=A0A9X9WMT1_9PROT|nr:peptidylprolyl isomerase [Neoroseomonas oryzicola]MBR0661641.1 peptidylprolyl isomerase [Neoroseomonas oryzicola]NKE16888.1 peptidylprolyl isomerase [Neoroseomonas oryzicola]
MILRSRPALPTRAGLALVLCLAGADAVRAQAPAPATPPGDPVVARVDGEPILLSDLAAAAQDLPEELRGAPPQMLYPLILDQMIAGRAVTAAARRARLDQEPEVRARIRRAEEQELQQAWLSREIASRVTDAAIRARYDRDIANRPAEEEVRARHILVPTESEARAALAEIRGGADFTAVAQRRSSGPGAREGGDLGFFRRGDMVPEFAEAAFALQPGQVSENPVRSPFGWHVIKVEERRQAAAPRFEEVAQAIRQQLLEAEVQAAVERARGAAQVERFNLDGSAPRPTDTAEPPAPAAPPARPGAPIRR